MTRKFLSIFVGLLLAATITATLTACGNNQDSTSSEMQTASSVSDNTTSDNTNLDLLVPDTTALENIEITIPEEFEITPGASTESSILFTLKTSATNNNGSTGTGNNNNGSTGTDNNNNGSTGTGNNNNGSTGTDGDNSENNGDNVTIRVINMPTTASDFQDSLDNPATIESMTEYLTNVLKYSDVVVTDYKRDMTDDEIRYEYRFTYTVNGKQRTELEFSCMTKDKFVAITVVPKSDAYLQQAEQVFRQVVDSFNPYQ